MRLADLIETNAEIQAVQMHGATPDMQVVPSGAILNATHPKTTLHILTLPLSAIIKTNLLHISGKKKAAKTL